MIQNKGKQLLSDLRLYSNYLKWRDDKQGFETWEEACVDVLETHTRKYGEKVRHLINEVTPSYVNGEFLTSQRNLQYRYESISKHNTRLYNCSVMYAYSPDCFSKGMYLLMSGCGLGINLRKKYVSQLPNIHKRNDNKTTTFVIPDTIEGWSEAIKVLISSYCKHKSLYSEYFGKQIRFDYSQIRPLGSKISGGFLAPGSGGLRKSIDLIESFIENRLGQSSSITFTSYIAYNVLMHLADAVLSGGVRRSATNIILDYEDKEMLYAKVGNWRTENPHFARSNNSVGLMKNQFPREVFDELINLNVGDNDIGFVLLESEDQMFNPCFEIGFDFYNQIKDLDYTVIQLCNLCEGNAMACYVNGKFREDIFYKVCRNMAIVGTLQAGYTSFPYLGEETERIVAGEALLGCSITGWMNVPELFNPEILQKGVEIIRETNTEVAELIGINRAARLTCTKPSGNASVILKTPSGIHPEHSERYFRIMQLNKESAVAKYIEEFQPFLLEESVWSANNTDYVIYVPIQNPEGAFYKDNLTDLKHLELINLVQKNWVFPGNNPECAYNPNIHHNVSNTVILDDKEKVVDYIFENQEFFVAVSFLDRTGDKDYNQAPFTSVLTENELLKTYGRAVILISGLIVDGLDTFDNNLWEACDYILDRDKNLTGLRKERLLKKDWLDRSRKFAKHYFKGDIKKLVYCLKDVHLFHKWCTINRELKPIDFSKVLSEPVYKNVNEMGAIACSGGSCEIPT